MLLAVPYGLESLRSKEAYVLLIVDIVMGAEQFRPLSEHLARETEVVGHVRGAVLVGAAFCSN